MYRRTLLGAGVTVVLGPFAAARRLDRRNLLQYRDERARVAPVHTVKDWLRRRSEIFAGMQQVMGPPRREAECS